MTVHNVPPSIQTKLQIQIQPIIANKMNNTRTKVKVLPSPQGVAGWHPQG